MKCPYCGGNNFHTQYCEARAGDTIPTRDVASSVQPPKMFVADMLKRLEEAEEVIRHYADEDNWAGVAYRQTFFKRMYVAPIGPDGRAGQRAVDYLKKHGLENNDGK